jgi:rod shape determining protein RodA
MILFVGVRLRTLFILGVVALITAGMAWNYLHEYQKRRVRVLFDPTADTRGEAWHITQSKIAVGSGELFGKGFLQGTQTQLEFLPERTTDFVFCVLAEEWGFLGSIAVLLAFFLLILRILYVAQQAKLLFASLLCVGVAVSLLFHVFVNIGMVIGILPVVGLPLPFFSYGGSALVTNSLALGLVFGVRARTGVFSEVLASSEGTQSRAWSR